MNNLRPLLLVTLLFIAAASEVKATPAEAISYLSKSPVSRLEWGLYRLSRSLEDGNFTNVRSVIAELNNDGKIVIALIAKPATGDINPETVCRKAITDLKKYLFLGQSQGGKTLLGSWFSSQALSDQNLPPDFGKSLEQITLIYLVYLEAIELPICESPLLEDKIELKKKIK